VLEGAVRTPVVHITDIKAQPPITPWNLGVFDALVLADKMTGCPGGIPVAGQNFCGADLVALLLLYESDCVAVTGGSTLCAQHQLVAACMQSTHVGARLVRPLFMACLMAVCGEAISVFFPVI
jgi:hypothetical protein